jgi:hypothetical protein
MHIFVHILKSAPEHKWAAAATKMFKYDLKQNANLCPIIAWLHLHTKNKTENPSSPYPRALY